MKDSSLVSPEKSTPATWRPPAHGLPGDTPGPDLLSLGHHPQKVTDDRVVREESLAETAGLLLHQGWPPDNWAQEGAITERSCTQAPGSSPILSVQPALRSPVETPSQGADFLSSCLCPSVNSDASQPWRLATWHGGRADQGECESLLTCWSVAQSCPTLCGPTDCSTPGFPVLHCLPEFAQMHVH